EVLKLIFLSRVFIERRVGLIVFFEFEGTDPYDTFDGIERDRVIIVARRYHQCTVHGDRKWQTDNEGRSLAAGRLDADASTQLFDFAGNDIHTHAATGKLRHLLGGTETSVEDELQYFTVGDLG